MIEFLRWTWRVFVVEMWTEPDPEIRTLARLVACIGIAMLALGAVSIAAFVVMLIMALRW